MHFLTRRKCWTRENILLPIFDGFDILDGTEHNLIVFSKCHSASLSVSQPFCHTVSLYMANIFGHSFLRTNVWNFTEL